MMGVVLLARFMVASLVARSLRGVSDCVHGRQMSTSGTTLSWSGWGRADPTNLAASCRRRMSRRVSQTNKKRGSWLISDFAPPSRGHMRSSIV